MNYALHNVTEMLAQPDGGQPFQRVPETTRLTLNPHAQEWILDVTVTEIRFVLEGRDLLTEWRGQSMDLLHATDFGDTIIAETLAKEITAWT